MINVELAIATPLSYPSPWMDGLDGSAMRTHYQLVIQFLFIFVLTRLLLLLDRNAIIIIRKKRS
jgi:hypothetical protein